MSQQFKTFGYSKNRTSDFNDFKKEIERKRNIFEKRRPKSNVHPKGDQLLIPQTPDSGIELHGANGGLPPEWVDHYDLIKSNLEKINVLHKELNGLISKRITDVFGKNHAKLDAQIKTKSQESMKLLHECEGHLQKIAQKPDFIETDADRSVRTNIHRSLAAQITEKTVLLRKQQKNLYSKIKETNGTGKSTNEFLINAGDTKASLDNFSPDEVSEMEMGEELGLERDAEINQLVDTMNELGTIFKQLNTLVIEQGNILDRIDYNIEQTLDNTKKANIQLKKAEKSQSNGCARYCIFVLVTLICVFSIILFLKYKK